MGSDSCSFCAKLAPVFESAAKEIKAKNGPPFAMVSADTGAELMKKYEITRFPSVYWFWQGHSVIELPRAAEKNVTQIVDWVDWVQLPAGQDLENSEYSENIERSQYVSETHEINERKSSKGSKQRPCSCTSQTRT